MATLNQSKNYRSFVNQRDQALESILHRYQHQLTDETNHLFNTILHLVQNNYERIIAIPNFYHHIDRQISIDMHGFLTKTMGIYKELRRSTYVLTISSEHEAINRALNTDKRLDVSKHDVDKSVSRDNAASNKVEARLDYSLVRLKNKIMDAVKLGIMNQDERKIFLQRVFDQLPKFKPVAKRKTLKKLIEADKKPTDISIEIQFTDETDWDKTVSDYMNAYIPKTRSPETVFDVDQAGGHKGYDPDVVYGWEIERDMTHDFVVSVREGMVDAAKANGIIDFVWIAIVDEKTCDSCCGAYGCTDFDGMTTSEIEKMTKGEVVSPPAHFNCAVSGHFIETNNGPKLIENIKIGDYVFTHKGNYKKVLSTIQSEVETTLKITLSDGTRLHVTEDHPLFHNGEWISAKDLKIGCNLISLNGEEKNDKQSIGNVDILNHETESLSKAVSDV